MNYAKCESFNECIILEERNERSEIYRSSMIYNVLMNMNTFYGELEELNAYKQSSIASLFINEQKSILCVVIYLLKVIRAEIP